MINFLSSQASNSRYGWCYVVLSLEKTRQAKANRYILPSRHKCMQTTCPEKVDIEKMQILQYRPKAVKPPAAGQPGR